MSIKTRLVLVISSLVALAFMAVGFVTVTQTRTNMINRVDTTLVVAAGKGGIDRQPPPGVHEEESSSSSKRAIATITFDSHGNLIQSEPSGFVDSPDPLPNLSSLGEHGLDEHEGHIFTVKSVGSGDVSYRVLIQRGPGDGYIAVAAPLTDVTGTVRNLIMVIVLTSVVVLAAAVVAVWFVVRQGLRPIDAMIDTAGLIATGDLSRRVEYQSETNEVGKLGRALNVMLAKIESSFQVKEQSERKLRQFIADASHELRTPLTSIRGYAELFRSGAASDPETLGRAMHRIESESMRMGKLVDDLLLLARLDQGRALRRDRVNLATIVENGVADARAVEPDRPITVETPEEVIVIGDADRLKQVIDNLLANARVHTERSTPVRVTVERTGVGVTVSVSDSGPGIAPKDLEHIFDRFFRVDTARTRERGGTGLGLSIVASIVEAQGGHVAVSSRLGEGTTFSFTLPVALEVAEPERDTLALPVGLRQR